MKELPVNRGFVALVDDEDFDRFCHLRFQEYRGYAFTTINKKRAPLHRMILASPPGMFTDHINGNRMDNRKCNLRIATRTESARNAKVRKDSVSGVRGVRFHAETRRWNAKIQVDKKRFSLGWFDTKEEAHAAYCEAAKKYHGEFARFN